MPALPLSENEGWKRPTTPFGKPMLKHFCMNPEYRNLNAATCGSWPKTVRDQWRRYLDDLEAQPDYFSEVKQGPVIQEARREVAQLLHARVSECVFISNATTGIYTVLHNIPFDKDDVIITFSTTYGAIDNAIASMAETQPFQTRKVTVDLPMRGEDIVARFEGMVAQIKAEGLHPRLAVLETIVSIPAIRMPFESLVQACQREGVLSLVDGAHSIGQFSLNLEVLQPDFFIMDCHKWLFVPRPCAALYVPERNQHYIRSTIPPSFGFIPRDGKPALPLWSKQSGGGSSGSTATDFETIFANVATQDNMPHMCIPTALKFRREVCGGEEAIYQYLRVLAKEGGDRVAAILGTEVLDEKPAGEYKSQRTPSEMRDCGIATVRLPLAVSSSLKPPPHSGTPYSPLSDEEVGPAVHYLSMTLAETHKTWLYLIDHGGYIWVRLCAQIYLDTSDFEWIGNVLKEICETIGKKGHVISKH
uniref:Aminotransferase, class V/Cysteine desulfurase n=1 Tax=Penicillium expansum TaxID=27334 RepID=UPI003467EE8D